MKVPLQDDWQIAKVEPLARWLAISPAKVLAWISARELRATNVAVSTSTRPSWRISREAFDAFWLARSVDPALLTPDSRRKQTGRPKSYV